MLSASLVKHSPNYLSRGIRGNEILVDLLGLGAQLGARLGVLVVLAGEVEGDVFLAVLRHQERSENTQPVCTQRVS